MHIDFFEPEPGIRLRWARWQGRGDRVRADVLLLNGRSEFVEKYDETAERLTGLGCRVWSLDWRGQGLSARLLANRQKGHIDDYATHVRDLRAFLDQVRADGGEPTLLIAHSMGGHIACRYLIDTPGHRIQRLVLCAPMIAPRFAWWQAPLVTGLTPLACLAGRRDAYALGQGDWDASRQSFDGNPLTHDQARFDWLVDTLRRRPDLRLGGVTWGWLAATRASTAHLLAPGHAERLTLPCLIVRAGQETIVDNARIADFAARLPDVTLHDISNARHEILRETDAVRAAFWLAFDRFCGGANA